MKRIIALALALVLSIGCAAADNKNFNIRFFAARKPFGESMLYDCTVVHQFPRF